MVMKVSGRLQVKYIRREKNEEGQNRWVFYPPEDVAKAKVLTKRTFTCRKKAQRAHRGLVETVERYRKGEIPGKTLTPAHTLSQAVAYYRTSPRFRSLSSSSSRNYSSALSSITSTNLGNKLFGDVKLKDLNATMCDYVYSLWLKEHSTSKSNHMKLIFGVLMSYLTTLDVVPRNFMASTKTVKHEPKSIVWTQDQVEKFLDVAFSDFKWRSCGLAVMMMYEWGQRPIDILRLTWENLDLDSGVVTITQSKRGATVKLPINEDLNKMLIKQKEDYGFQEFVIPVLSSERRYVPYNKGTFSSHVNSILELAGLPKELSAGYLRKSAIVEMVEAGVDATQIMSVTGHRSLNSLSPYMKHTLKASTSALNQRRKSKHGD